MATNTAHNQNGMRLGETEKIPLTREGYEEKKARLHFLVTERRQQVADYIHEAKEAGDISESSAYEDAKNTQAMVEGEIQELQHLLEHAYILQTDDTRDHKITRLGSIVDVETNDGRKRTFQLVSTVEASTKVDGTSKISDQSPVGRALMGHAVGDRVEVTTPGGTVTYSIRAIR